MFGFLHPNNSALTLEEKRVQKAYLCGLCKTLSSEYGLLACALTTYEGNLLYLLTDAQTDNKPIFGRYRCPLNPIKKPNRVILSTNASQFTAAMSILLFTEKLKDDVRDEKSFKAKMLLLLLKRKIPKAEATLNKFGINPAFLVEIIEEQWKLEQKTNLRLEDFAKPTASLLETIFKFTFKLTCQFKNKIPLSNIGYNLGQIIYLLDSYADYHEDVELKCFNPLLVCNKSSKYKNSKNDISVNIKNELACILERSLKDIESNVETLSLYRNKAIIQNTLVSSLRRQIQQILSMGNNNYRNKKVSALAFSGGGGWNVTPKPCGEGYDVTPKTDCCDDCCSGCCDCGDCDCGDDCCSG